MRHDDGTDIGRLASVTEPAIQNGVIIYIYGADKLLAAVNDNLVTDNFRFCSHRCCCRTCFRFGDADRNADVAL